MKPAIVAILAALAGCAALSSSRPRVHWDVDTGEVDCPSHGVLAAIGTVIGAASAAGYGAYKLRHPDLQMYDQYGFPTNIVHGTDYYHGFEYVGAGVAASATVVAFLEMSANARCRDLDRRVRALVRARDCATVVRLDAQLGKADPELRASVRANEPTITACLAKLGTPP